MGKTTALTEANLEEFWQDVKAPDLPKRPKTLPLQPLAPNLAIQQWREALIEGGPPILTVPGNVTGEWGDGRLFDGFRLQLLTDTRCALESLLSHGTPVIGEPLRQMVDENFYLVSDAFKLLLEASFQRQETGDIKIPAETVIRWASSHNLEGPHAQLAQAAGIKRTPESPQERLDVLCFILTLAHHNGLSDPTVTGLDRIERVVLTSPRRRKPLLGELALVMSTIQRWSKLGSHLGLLLGINDQNALESFEQYSPKLGKTLKGSLVN